MSANNMGEVIVKLREKAGLSQIELGKILGVSPQAVSRWEHGGMPDAALLPKLAATLNCTPNQLYGIETVEGLDIKAQLSAAILNTPAEKWTTFVTDLAWHMIKIVAGMDPRGSQSGYDMLTSCENADLRPGNYATRVDIPGFDGVFQASVASNFRYVFMMAEPEDGFAATFKNPEAYRKLFALFGRIYRLEILLLSYTLPAANHFTADFVCQKLGIAENQAQEALEDLFQHNMLERTCIYVAQQEMYAYRQIETSDIVPFLYFCGTMMRDGSGYLMKSLMREEPILRSMDSIGSQWHPGNKESISQTPELLVE